MNLQSHDQSAARPSAHDALEVARAKMANGKSGQRDSNYGPDMESDALPFRHTPNDISPRVAMRVAKARSVRVSAKGTIKHSFLCLIRIRYSLAG